MQFLVSLLLGASLLACRTTKDEDQRYFADGKGSSEGIASISVNPPPNTKPGKPLPILPQPQDPPEKGPFYRVCAANDQLTSQQSLTVKALLAAVHQQSCADGERWLRDPRNRSLMIDTEELIELQTLALLQSYPQIRDIYIKIARGVDPICPLLSPQNCHFLLPEF